MLQIEIIEKMSETRRMEGTENIDGKKEKKITLVHFWVINNQMMKWIVFYLCILSKRPRLKGKEKLIRLRKSQRKDSTILFMKQTY